MNVLCTQATNLVGTSILLTAGTVYEISPEWYQPQSMTRLGVSDSRLAGKTTLATLVPGFPAVPNT